MNDKDLTRAFGDLRSLINQDSPALSSQVWTYAANLPHGRPRLLQLMIDVQREAPAHYKQQWLPYLHGVALPPIFISSQKDLKSLAKVLPDRGIVRYSLLSNRYELSVKSLTTFARIEALRQVHTLEVLCRLEHRGIDTMCASPHLVHLRHLLITSLHLQPHDIGPLLDSLHTDALDVLDLGNSEMMVEGAQVLARHPALAHLTSLCLSSNDLESASLTALASSPTMSNLRELKLSYNHIGDEALFALASSGHLMKLERLELQCNKITDDGAFAILHSTKLPNLRTLDLRTNDISDTMSATLAETFSPF